MAGLPVLAGADQETNRLVVLPETAATLGAPGAAGGSSTSMRSTSTPPLAMPPLPSSAWISKENDGLVSKSSRPAVLVMLVRIWPVEPSILNGADWGPRRE